MVQAFLGPKLKYQRAKSHIHELEGVLEAIASRNPYRLVGELDPETEAWQVRVDARESVCEIIPLIVGDAVHNLRSALDILVNDLLTITKPNEARDARFPFWKTPQGRAGALKRIKSLEPRLKSSIEALKPYTGMDGQGNALLYGIHELDIIDKHKIIIAVSYLNTITSYQGGDEITVSFMRLPVKDGDIVASGTGLDTFKVYKDPKGTFDVAFADAQPFKGDSIARVLADMANMVYEIIEGFERFSLASGLIHG